MKDFRQLKVWQRAHQLTRDIYKTTASFPRSEAYGLMPQIRRAAVSITSNLAEGCGRNGDAELARYCSIASGSASELEYQILLARDLQLIKPEDYEKLAQQTTEIKRMLTVFVQKLKADSARPPPMSDIWLRPRAALGSIGCRIGFKPLHWTSDVTLSVPSLNCG